MKLYENFIGHKSGAEGENKVKELIADGVLLSGISLVDASGNKTIIEDITKDAIHLRIFSKKKKDVEKTGGMSYMQWDYLASFGRRIQEEKLEISV